VIRATRLEPSNLRKAFNRMLVEAGLRRVRFHDLRHTFGSLLLQQGESLTYVKDQMGHSSIQVTVDIYGHLVPGVIAQQLISSTSRYQRQERSRNNTKRRRQVESGSRVVANRKEDQTWAPKYLIFWRAWRDSNPQPSDPKFVLIRIQPYHQSKKV
jgi:hypothetical protein